MSIVELLVALVIVMIVFAGLASTIIATFSSIRNNEARVRGVALANELVEEMAEIPWRHLGLLDDDDDLFDADGKLHDPNVCDGDDLVVLEQAGGEDDPFLSHQEVIERDGREYHVERCIVRIVGPEEKPELIGMMAQVSWSVAGDVQTVRNDGVRAPDSQDLFDLEVLVEALARPSSSHSSSDGSAMWLHHSGHEDYPSRNRSPIDVTAELGIVGSSVELRYRDRNGTLHVEPGPEAQVGQSERTWTISANTRSFRHGSNSFTVVATGPQGQVASDTATLRFYQELQIQPPTVRQDGVAANVVRVDASGNVCDHVQVEVDVEGMTPGEANPGEGGGGLTAFWAGVTDGVAVQMNLIESRTFGGSFYVEIEQVVLEPGDDGDMLPVDVVIVADRRTEFEEDVDNQEFSDTDDVVFPLEVEVGVCA